MTKYAFTLAEVLITLGIIGIVAAMTLPSIIGRYKKQETIVKLKTSINILNNAFRGAVADYGDMSNWDYIDNLDNQDSRKAFIDKYLIPYIKGSKPSKTAAYNYTTLGYPSQYPPRQPNGSGTGMSSTAFYPISLVNGIFFYSASPDSSGRLVIDVDINGFHKPNIFGYDLFVFLLDLSKNSVYAVGYDYPNPMTYCTPGNAWSCAAAIIQNHYEIPDNYPVKF